jgi:hypothetical protein
MSMRWFLVLAVAAGSAAAAGCGNAPGFYSVSGKVLYKGEPASGAIVYFHRADAPPSGGKGIPFGVANENGGFSLTCDGVGAGCPPGKYDVLVEWRGQPDATVQSKKSVRGKGKVTEPAVNRQMARQGVDRLKGRYFDIAKPLLHAEVLPQPNSLPPFELND